MPSRSSTESIVGIYQAFLTQREWRQADLARALGPSTEGLRKRLTFAERGAQNLAKLRGLALMILERDTSFKAGIARKQGRVARKAACREHVLTVVFQGD